MKSHGLVFKMFDKKHICVSFRQHTFEPTNFEYYHNCVMDLYYITKINTII